MPILLTTPLFPMNSPVVRSLTSCHISSFRPSRSNALRSGSGLVTALCLSFCHASVAILAPSSTRRASSSANISCVWSFISCKDLISSLMRSSLLLHLSFFIYDSRDIFSVHDVINIYIYIYIFLFKTNQRILPKSYQRRPIHGNSTPFRG